MKYDNSKAQGSALTTFLGGIAILLAVLFLLVKLATSGYFYHSVDESTPQRHRNPHHVGRPCARG